MAKTKSEPQQKQPKEGTVKRPAKQKPAEAKRKRPGQGKGPKGPGAADDTSLDLSAGEPEEDERREQNEDTETDNEPIEVTGELVDDAPSDDPVVDDDGEPASLGRAGGRVTSSLPPPSSKSSETSVLGPAAALSRTDPLQAYLREVQRHPLLTPDEEKSLTVRYTKTQDVNTAARLVTANLRLVVKLAYEYRRAYKNIMDLIQEGNIGLMQAVKRYDPYRGVKLSSYAAWWIRAYILRFILNNWRLVKLGTTQAQRKLFFNLSKEKAKLAQMGIEPTSQEIARRLSVDEKDVIDMDVRLSSNEASLDAPAGDAEGRPIARVELLPSSNTGPESALEAMEVSELVHDHLTRFRDTLKGKDVVIFDKRMTADEPLTLQELGNEFGISRERVRQLEARLTTKLREYLKDELGDAVGAP